MPVVGICIFVVKGRNDERLSRLLQLLSGFSATGAAQRWKSCNCPSWHRLVVCGVSDRDNAGNVVSKVALRCTYWHRGDARSGRCSDEGGFDAVETDGESKKEESMDNDALGFCGCG